MNRREQGQSAEDAVAQYLLEQGWTMIARRAKLPGGELDLIAIDGDQLVVVEVKERQKGDPLESIDFNKRRNLRRAAEAFVERNGLEVTTVRFDAVAITPKGLEHVRDFLDTPD